MKIQQLQLLACYEGDGTGGVLSSPFYRLDGEMSDEACRAYLFAQARYGADKTDPATLEDAVENLLRRNSAILAGGIVALKGEFVLLPGCCCGIESWRSWRSIEPEGYSPWMGHDPNPYIDTAGKFAVLHSDLEPDGMTTQASYEEIQSALDQTERDLKAFLSRLREWLEREGFNYAGALTGKIDEWYSISQ